MKLNLKYNKINISFHYRIRKEVSSISYCQDKLFKIVYSNSDDGYFGPSIKAGNIRFIEYEDFAMENLKPFKKGG